MDGVEVLLLRVFRSLLEFSESQVYGINPYVEYADREGEISLTSELAGVKPQDIRVSVSEGGIRLKVLSRENIVYSRFFRSSKLKRESAKMTYINNILKINVMKK